MNGIFRQLVYEESSVSTDAVSETFPNNTQYIHRPLYALVEITKSTIECNFEQLQSNIVPIPLMEQTFRVDIADILPKDKRPKDKWKGNFINKTSCITTRTCLFDYNAQKSRSNIKKCCNRFKITN